MRHLSQHPATTFLTVFVFSVCRAQQNCGDIECPDNQHCCAPWNSSSVAARCCELRQHTFIDNLDWITRKLSGILILLLLFAMGFFIQRIVCPRPRRQGDGQEQQPAFLASGTATSQDNLLECVTSPVSLPAYDEVKDLPTYEETMKEAHGRRAAPAAETGRPYLQFQHCLRPLSNTRTLFG